MAAPLGIPQQFLPPAPASVADAIVNNINTSPIFIGLMMLTMNLGARFLPAEITRVQESMLSHPYFRRFLIFVILFIATRNIVYAFWLSLIIIFAIGYLFNENSALCIFNGGAPGSTCSSVAIPSAPTVMGMINTAASQAALGLTPEEGNILRQLTEKQARAAQTAAASQKAVAGSSPLDGSSAGQQRGEASIISNYYANLGSVQRIFGF
jgi:hypothetical protein